MIWLDGLRVCNDVYIISTGAWSPTVLAGSVAMVLRQRSCSAKAPVCSFNHMFACNHDFFSLQLCRDHDVRSSGSVYACYRWFTLSVWHYYNRARLDDCTAGKDQSIIAGINTLPRRINCEWVTTVPYPKRE